VSFKVTQNKYLTLLEKA